MSQWFLVGFAFNTAIFCMKKNASFHVTSDLKLCWLSDVILFSTRRRVLEDSTLIWSFSLREAREGNPGFLFGEKTFLERYANSKPTQCFAWENHPKPPANWRNTSFLSLPGASRENTGLLSNPSVSYPKFTNMFFSTFTLLYIYIL